MLAQHFIDRPVFAWVIALLILLGGGLALRQLPVASYPAVAPPALSITIDYPGASAQVIEDTAVALIEQEMNGIDNLLYMDSASQQNRGSITLTFAAGADLDLASVETQNRIKRTEARLPEEVRRLGVTVQKSARNFLLIATLYSPDKSLDNVALGSYAAANVLNELRRTPGVGEVLLFGTEYSMRLWLSPQRMQALGVTAADVARAVRADNIQLATGELGQLPSAPGQELNAIIVTRSRLSTPKEFGDVIIRSEPNGATVRVRDVARVELGAQDYSVAARIDGQPTAAVAVRLAPSANALDTARAVKQKLAELEQYFPEGIAWTIPYDTSRFVEISIVEVLKTLGEAMLLVVLVMFVFLGSVRATFIPAIVVPVALVGATVGLYLFGYSINVLTLFAMVLAIGIVVDDAIVVVENVERIISEENLTPREATRKAMKQIVGAIIAITLVLAAVFMPMAFFGGSTGAIYRQFSVTLVLAMGFSALMAFTLTPALCATLLKHKSKPGEGQGGAASAGGGFFQRGFAAVVRAYVAVTRRIISKPLRWLVVYGAIVAATVHLFTALPTSFLPEEDQGYFITLVQLPPGATRERTLEVLSAVEQHYLDMDEVRHVVGVAGFSFVGRGQNTAIVFTRLKDWEERPGAQQGATAVVQAANKALFRIKQAFAFAINPPPIPELAAVGGFDMRLQDRAGLGRDELLAARNMVLGMAGANPVLSRVRPDGLEPAPQLFLDIDRERAGVLGIDSAELNSTLQSALGGAYINDFVREGRILRVQMQADADLRKTPDAILQLPVRNRTGDMIPLAQIARSQWIVGAPKLDRYNGLPAMKISGSPAPGRSSGEAIKAMEDIAASLPPGIGFEWSGSSFEERQSGAQAPLLFGLSLLVVFLCLAALYESWSIPFAVLLVVPLGLFGAVGAVSLRDLSDDIYFKVGVIAIIGLSAKNAILIIEFARELHAEGKDLLEATLEACRRRFRPILMTSFAFIMGVLPLALSTGAGANSRHALGTGVIGGMLAATLLAVFLVPVFFVVVRRMFPERRRGDAREEA